MAGNRNAKIIFFITLLMFVSSIAIGGYEKSASGSKAKSKDDLYSQVELFADTVGVLRNEYVDEVDSKKLIYGALKGMLSSMDDFSSFLEPDEYNQIKIEARGEFGGVGVEISLKDGVITVITPIVDSPAEKAGIKAGDKIVKIDGTITKDMSMNDSVKKMRGNPGTVVTLTVWREKDEKILEIPIKRAMIKIESIKKAKLIEGKTGYIKLVEFQEKTAADLEAALKKLEAEGMDSLILDLRNNPGGLLDCSVDVAEKFLPKDKVIVSIKARNPEQNMVFKSRGRALHPDYPLIVMVNEGSASASEIAAGAIQDNKRGVVLGTTTFGKASVQTVMPLKDGSAIRFTTAFYLTPNGKMIKGQGITPDVVVAEEESPVKDNVKSADIIFEKVEKQGAPQFGKEEKKEIVKKDNQLEMAVNLIKAMKIYKNEK